MNTQQRLDGDLKEAMKAKNETVVTALRMIRSAMKNKQIDLGHELTEEETVAVIRSIVKQYKDALADFTNAGRTDLAEKQKAEIELIERYLPPAMSDEELGKITDEVLAEMGEVTAKDLGKIMGAVIKRVGGRADGNSVRNIVQKRLG